MLDQSALRAINGMSNLCPVLRQVVLMTGARSGPFNFCIGSRIGVSGVGLCCRGLGRGFSSLGHGRSPSRRPLSIIRASPSPWFSFLFFCLRLFPASVPCVCSSCKAYFLLVIGSV